MKKLAKDIVGFGAASMMGGALSVGAGKLGMGSAMSGVSEMMPVVGQTMMLGHTVRMTSKLMPKKGKKSIF